jgi:hypothetical protein
MIIFIKTYLYLLWLLSGIKKPSSEASLFGSDTGSEGGIFATAACMKKIKWLLSVATTGVYTSTLETPADILGSVFLVLSNDWYHSQLLIFTLIKCLTLRVLTWHTHKFDIVATLVSLNLES